MQNNFSPNMLKTYQTCPRKFYFQYIEGLNVPKATTPFEKGKKIHALANYYLQGVNIDKLEQNLNSDEIKTWQRLKQNEYYLKDCYKSEFSLTCRVGNYWVNGRLDAVVYENNNYYILDYKTGSIPQNPEFDFQTMIYLLCLDQYLENYNSLSFVYINLKENKNFVIKFNSDLRAEYVQKIISACEKIENDKIYPTSSDCKYCEFKKICVH
ncbi:PD-(D/E)XK nuclease family protein [bacterium]|nr:PD-(D/E)XK nuclease family protein [bacterium]